MKPYIEIDDYNNEPLDEFANKIWSLFLKRNKSFIVDLFYGQFYTRITCPDCSNVSIACNPFDMLSLNIPSKKKDKFEAYMIFHTFDKKTLNFEFFIDNNKSVREIKSVIFE